MTEDTTMPAHNEPVAGPVQRPVRPLRKTRARLAALEDLARGKITHPGPGVAAVLEKAGAVRWDRPANTYRITAKGVQMAREWAGICVVSVPAHWLALRPNAELTGPRRREAP